MSDNGGRTTIPKAPKSELDRNAPLRDGKHTFYEGGIRVPFIALGPGVKPNSVCTVPVTGVDILPTFAELAGYPDPLPDNIDGGSIRQLLHNDGQGTVKRASRFLYSIRQPIENRFLQFGLATTSSSRHGTEQA